MPEPLLRQIETNELRRVAIAEEVEHRAENERMAQSVRSLTEAQVGRILKEIACEMDTFDRDHLKDFLRSLVEKIELDAQNLTYPHHQPALCPSMRQHLESRRRQAPQLRASARNQGAGDSLM